MSSLQKGGLRAMAAAVMLAAAGCSSVIGGGEKIKALRVRAVPGPDAFDANYSFRRGELEMAASAFTEGDRLKIKIELNNRGAAKLNIRDSLIFLRARGSDITYPVSVEDEKSAAIVNIWLMPHEVRKLVIQPADKSVALAAPLVLEFRGVRDEYGGGGYEFDLQAEEIPTEADPNSLPPKRPVVEDAEVWRPLRDSMTTGRGEIRKKDN